VAWVGVDLQIEGVSYIEGGAPDEYMVDLASVTVDLDIAVMQPRAEFDVVIWHQAITRPKGSQQVVMLNGDGTREYGGIINMVAETELLPTVMSYHCTCGDWSKWFDAHLVINTFQAQPVDQLVRSIVDQYVNVPGTTRVFTTDHVSIAGPIPQIPIIQFAYLPPSQCIAQLQQMTGFGFFVDEFMDVWFYSFTQYPSPLPNNTLNADDLYDAPGLTSATPDWVNLTISEDISQVKNKVYITGILLAASALYSDQTTGDGVTTVFPMAYQAPNDLTQITVSVNGTLYEVGLDQLDSVPGGPCAADAAYVNFSAQTVRFCVAPPAGSVVTFTYYPMVAQAVVQADQAAIDLMASRDGTDGVREYNRMDPSLSAESPALANGRALMTLKKYAYPYKSLQFESFLPGWFPGQSFTFQSQRRFDGEYSGMTFFVLRVSKTIIRAIGGEWMWKYTISAASIPYEV
jgi:hypothetical protein